ncbi:MAG: glycosyltransferase family 4 protein [Bacteroidota bacterium]
MTSSPKILILYTEVAGYLLDCLNYFQQQTGGEVHIVHWPVKDEAPFDLSQYPALHFHPRAELDQEQLEALYHRISPDAVFMAGWRDRGYFKLAPKVKKAGIPVICGIDNHWKGTNKQKLLCWLSPLVIHRRYTHLWIPGVFQRPYAERLGFDDAHILEGLYSANTSPFAAAHQTYLSEKSVQYPKEFLFVGRFLELKGIREMVSAFLQIQEEYGPTWKLKFVGAGPLRGVIPDHPQIILQDFLQPKELPALARTAGCLLLPSHRDAWGVAMHEFAAAGLPLIASKAVGAGPAFIEVGKNGYLTEPGDAQSLYQAMASIVQKTDAELLAMGARSHELSQQIGPDTWTATLMRALGEKATA